MFVATGRPYYSHASNPNNTQWKKPLPAPLPAPTTKATSAHTSTPTHSTASTPVPSVLTPVITPAPITLSKWTGYNDVQKRVAFIAARDACINHHSDWRIEGSFGYRFVDYAQTVTNKQLYDNQKSILTKALIFQGRDMFLNLGTGYGKTVVMMAMVVSKRALNVIMCPLVAIRDQVYQELRTITAADRNRHCEITVHLINAVCLADPKQWATIAQAMEEMVVGQPATIIVVGPEGLADPRVREAFESACARGVIGICCEDEVHLKATEHFREECWTTHLRTFMRQRLLSREANSMVSDVTVIIATATATPVSYTHLTLPTIYSV